MEKQYNLILDCLNEYRESSPLAKAYIKHNHQVGCLTEFAQIVLDKYSEQKNTNEISDAIKFAEWLSENEWVKRTFTHPNKVGQYWSHKHCEYKTIEQLYDIFSGRSEQLPCSYCGRPLKEHSKDSKLCPDRMKNFKQGN